MSPWETVSVLFCIYISQGWISVMIKYVKGALTVKYMFPVSTQMLTFDLYHNDLFIKEVECLE